MRAAASTTPRPQPLAGNTPGFESSARGSACFRLNGSPTDNQVTLVLAISHPIFDNHRIFCNITDIEKTNLR
jgi:hypothetical protein